ncbi:hypothetical protein GCM10020000_31750 [Streptomyces olivoverticillatus]
MPCTLDPVARTARLTAALRARESARPDRLFDDPLAASLAGDTGRALLDEFGDVPAIAVRTRFYDDALTRLCTADDGPRQLVLVAAGMDSRAYRLDLPVGTTVFELDRPELLAVKETLLADAGALPPAARVTRSRSTSPPTGPAPSEPRASARTGPRAGWRKGSPSTSKSPLSTASSTGSPHSPHRAARSSPTSSAARCSTPPLGAPDARPPRRVGLALALRHGRPRPPSSPAATGRWR